MCTQEEFSALQMSITEPIEIKYYEKYHISGENSDIKWNEGMSLTFIQVGSTFLRDDCSSECTCEESSSALVCKDNSCRGDQQCLVVEGEERCACEPDSEELDGQCKTKGKLKHYLNIGSNGHDAQLTKGYF